MDSYQPISGQPLVVSRRSSATERQVALTHIYHQALERQPYAFERKILATAEKDFLKDKIGVRRFLKELGHSEVYLKAFYYNVSNVKFLDLCFKHFMGRAPQGQTEIQFYCQILTQQGVKALVTAILDSEEYRKVFGCFTVPYARHSKYYESPNAYLESRFLNHEHFGQRGWAVATMYWHQLGLNCDAGVCSRPEMEGFHSGVNSSGADLGSNLLAALRALDPVQARHAIGALSPTEREALRQAIH